MLRSDPVAALARGLQKSSPAYIPEVLQVGPVPCFQNERVPEHLARQYLPLLLQCKQAGLWQVRHETFGQSGRVSNVWFKAILADLYLGLLRLADDSYVVILEDRTRQQALLLGQLFEQNFIISGQFQHRRKAYAAPAKLPAQPSSADLLNRLCFDYSLGVQEFGLAPL